MKECEKEGQQNSNPYVEEGRSLEQLKLAALHNFGYADTCVKPTKLFAMENQLADVSSQRVARVGRAINIASIVYRIKHFNFSPTHISLNPRSSLTLQFALTCRVG